MVKFKRQTKNQPQTLAANDTTITDSFGRPVEISDKPFIASNVTGLFPIAYLLDKLKLLEPVERVLEEHFPVKKNTLIQPKTMFRQRLLALAAGYKDLNDLDSLCNDPGFMAVVGTQRIAGSSNLCRFENRFDRISIDKLNQTLLEAFCIATKQLNLLPKYRKKNYRCLFLDVDSTFVELHGNQEEKSYNGHYGMSCLAPVLCYLQNYPIAVFGAGGTNDARKVLEHQLKRLIKRLQKAFPDYLIVLRGDAGFNSKFLIDTCDACGIKYITGLSPNKKAEAMPIKYARAKKVKRYTESGHSFRLTGKINYRAKSWTKERRVVARKQYLHGAAQGDLRLIQTNIVHTTDRSHPGFSGELSAFSNDKLYVKAYCGRGNMERMIGEFKTECFGARASASQFTTNCYRMILAMYCQLILKIARRFRTLGLKGSSKSPKKDVEQTVRIFRRDSICITTKTAISPKRVALTLPAHLHDEAGFLAMFNIPI